MIKLQQPIKGQYLGMSYEDASRKAGELTAQAVNTGQTVLLSEHLSELVMVMKRHA